MKPSNYNIAINVLQVIITFNRRCFKNFKQFRENKEVENKKLNNKFNEPV